MKKVSLLILVSIVLLFAFTSCDMITKLPEPLQDLLGQIGLTPEDDHVHEWTEATCDAPKTCACGETEGEALGHDWTEATCETLKTCKTCQKTEGELADHNWLEATCAQAKTCSVCGKKDGKALSHTWIDATCETVKQCSECGQKSGKPLGHLMSDAVCGEAASCQREGCNYVEGEPLAHNWVDATCTTPKTCDLCQATDGEALGHKWSEATCTAPKTCSVCEGTEGEALGHQLSDATCTEAPTCSVCGETEGEALGHDFGAASCTEAATCSVCGFTSGEAIGHDMTEPSCTEPAYCQREGCEYTEGEATSHALTATYGESVVYACTKCGESYAVQTGYYMDGTKETLKMTPVNNNKNGYLNQNDYPVSKDGHYELLLGKNAEYTLEPQFNEDGTPVLDDNGEQIIKTNPGDVGQLQMWIPSNSAGITGFTSGNWAVGFYSFKFNSRMEFPLEQGNIFRMQFVDFSSSGGRWSPEWCIPGYFFAVESLYGDMTEVNIMGYDNYVLKTVTLGEDKFTGWIDVKIGIVLDPELDVITLHYYIDNEYIESISKPLTTTTNGINSIYITGSTVTEGTGVMLDDIAFGYTTSGYWAFDEHTHTWDEGDCVTPRTCVVCGETDGEAGGHVWVDATCTTAKTCSVCNETEGEALGHDFGVVACQEAGVCSRCDLVTEAIDHVWADATCTEPQTCTRDNCGATQGEALGHDWNDATCTVAKTCKVCDTTEGDPLGHDFADATCTEPQICKVCGFKQGEPNGHFGGTATCTVRANCEVCGVSYGDLAPHVGGTATCTERAVCDVCGNAYGSPLGHNISAEAVDTTLVYSCGSCDASYTVDTIIYNIDGSDYANLEGRANSANFTVGNGEQPAIVDGHYELINNTGNRGQLQLWIPGENKNQIGYTAENNAVGFFSLKLNAFLQSEKNEAVSIKLVDSISNQGDNRWQPGGVIGDVLLICAMKDGYTELQGMGVTIAKIKVVDDENDTDYFTGWVDIKVGLELNEAKDQITFHYYVDGQHVTTFSQELKTVTNAFNSIYVSGYTTTEGSGVMFDDIVLGYTKDGEWTLDSCAHEFEDATCTAPAKCKLCGAVDGEKLGHIGGEATCTDLAVCTRCEQPYGELGHVYESVCGEAPVCELCGEVVGEAPKHAALTWSYADGAATYSCATCGTSYVVDTNYYFDGENFDNMELNDERCVFDVKDATHNDGNGWDIGDPVVNEDGQYAVLNSKGTNPAGTSKATLWIPCTNGGQENFEGFTCEDNAVGFFSFKMNAYVDNKFAMQLVDTDTRGGGSNPAGNFWTEGALPEFFQISIPAGGKVNVTGWCGTLATFDVDENNFSGWFDVTIGIELTDDNKVTLDYYINGEYVGSATKNMNIITGKIDGVYMQVISSKVGSGFMFDDLCFGYVSTPAAE